MGEVADEAKEYQREGMRFLHEGKAEAAVESLREAYVLERRNRSYQLSLIEALIAAHKESEADVLLDDVLQSASNDGPSNLVAARLKAAEGKTTEAEAYYHRAIYGGWYWRAQNVAGWRLVDYLAENYRRQALLAELIPLEEESGPSERVAQLFLKAGSPSRAAQTYQAFRETIAGLGDARLEGGDYGAALNAFLQAFSESRTTARSGNAWNSRVRWRRSIQHPGGCLRERSTAAVRVFWIWHGHDSISAHMPRNPLAGAASGPNHE